MLFPLRVEYFLSNKYILYQPKAAQSADLKHY